MATVKCAECGVGDSVAICSETGVPLCANCAESCQVCHAPVSRKRVNLTSTGRKLCARCMAERNARRKAQKERLRREAEAKKDAQEPLQPSAPSPVSVKTPAAPAKPAAAAPESTSFEALMADEPRDSTSFSALAAGEPEPPEPRRAAKPEPEDRVGRENGDTREYGLEGAPQEGGKRLELGPIDENRPILASSGYQAPSKWKYAIAFLIFGIAGILFLSISPQLRDVMWPWDTPGLKFWSDREAPILDRNSLRDTSNLSQLDLFSQGPIFLISWSIVVVYVVGCVLIVTSVVRSAISSYLAKRRLRKIQEQSPEGYSFPG